MSSRRTEQPRLIGLTSIFFSSFKRAISLDSATISPRDVEKSPLPHLVKRSAALVALSSSGLLRMALLSSQGVFCCSPPEVYLFASRMARMISYLLMEMDGKPVPGTLLRFGCLLGVEGCMVAFSSSLKLVSWSMSICSQWSSTVSMLWAWVEQGFSVVLFFSFLTSACFVSLVSNWTGLVFLRWEAS